MHPDLSSCGKYPWSIHLLMIFDNMGDISLMLSFKTEFEILLRPAPLSFNSFITFSISVALEEKNTNELILRFLRNCKGLVGELGN